MIMGEKVIYITLPWIQNQIWVFPKIGLPQNGWFIVKNPIKMDDLGGPPLFLETSICFGHFGIFGIPLGRSIHREEIMVTTNPFSQPTGCFKKWGRIFAPQNGWWKFHGKPMEKPYENLDDLGGYTQPYFWKTQLNGPSAWTPVLKLVPGDSKLLTYQAPLRVPHAIPVAKGDAKKQRYSRTDEAWLVSQVTFNIQDNPFIDLCCETSNYRLLPMLFNWEVIWGAMWVVFLHTGCVRMMSCGSLFFRGVLLNKWSNTSWLVTTTMYCNIPKKKYAVDRLVQQQALIQGVVHNQYFPGLHIPRLNRMTKILKSNKLNERNIISTKNNTCATYICIINQAVYIYTYVYHCLCISMYNSTTWFWQHGNRNIDTWKSWHVSYHILSEESMGSCP